MLDKFKEQLTERDPRALIIAVLAAIVLLLMLGSGVYVYGRYHASAQNEQTAADKEAAAALADQFAAALQTYTEALKKAASDPAVVAALTQNDRAALDGKSNELTARIPGALKVRILPKGLTDTDNTSTPPLTYASLSMLRVAETTTIPVPAEVHLFGTPAQHMVMMARVRGTRGEMLGVVHAAFSTDVLTQALTDVKPSNAYIELRQPNPKSLTLAQSGANGPPTGVIPVTAPVKNSQWEIVYWRAPTGFAPLVKQAPASISVVQWPLLAGGVLATLTLVAVIVVFMRRRTVGGIANGETAILRGAVVAIMQGVHPGLERLIPHLPKAAPGTHATPMTISEGAEGEDITVVVKPASVELAASLERKLKSAQEKPAPAAEIEVNESPKPEASTKASEEPPEHIPPPSIFRAYDIRGVVGETLTTEHAYQIAKAIGSAAEERGQQSVIIGRDGRLSSPELTEAVIRGLRDSGRDVIDIGMVPTPVLYYATQYLETSNGVMITGSHNPPSYNGFKIILDDETLAGDAIQSLRRRLINDDLTEGHGELQNTEIVAEYIQRISEDIPVALGASLRIVVDCGNGVAGGVAPRLLRALGHDVLELFCDVDGNFPNHHPDPSQPENLKTLIAVVREQQADLGLAFDGDGDRLGVVDGDGNILWPDRQMMLFARDVLSRNPGAEIIYDVKCSRALKQVIEESGGKPVMWKTGHSLIKAKLKESGAPLAGEMSGHIFFRERWYGFDDALYSAARLLEILIKAGRPPREVFAALPGGVATPELRLDMPEDRHAAFMKELIATAKFDGAEISTIDGLRVDYPKAWGLIRPSNTTPCLILRFEGDDPKALSGIQNRFRALLQKLNPDLKLPF
ncbi:MAG TPA: phosphomannomutase/phosphoglucomutase [Gammaproteobacteria bacterium]|nr:phosphomannomutase/phosphoglucomutase [Gammaproteobacteria bacterium]